MASEVKAKLLSLLMKGGGQSGYMLKRIRVFSLRCSRGMREDKTPLDAGLNVGNVSIHFSAGSTGKKKEKRPD